MQSAENMLKAVGVRSRIGREDLASPLVCFPAITRLHDIAGTVAVLRRILSERDRLVTQAAPGSARTTLIAVATPSG
jgi:hypothetical protein